MFSSYINCSERHVLYPRVYIYSKSKKCVGYEKETTAEGISTPRAEKILTRESVLSGFLDITAASRLVGAADYTQSIYARAIYTPLVGLSSCTLGDRPIFAFPSRLIKRFQSHMRVSHIRIKVSLEIKNQTNGAREI
jgi:hypothetical protein